MKKFLILLFFAMPVSSLPVSAQTTKLVDAGFSTGLGSDAIVLGGGIETKINKTEIHGYGSYLYGWKTGSKLTFNEVSLKGRGVRFLTKNIGAYSDLRFQRGWTSQYSKNQVEYSVGGVFTLPSYDLRMYLGYLQQFHNGIDSHGVETNKLKGVEFSPQMEIGKFHGVGNRLGTTWQVLHGYSQGNQFCDGTIGPLKKGCERASWINGSVSITWTFEFGGK